MYKFSGVLFIVCGLMLLVLGIIYPIALIFSIGAFYLGIKTFKRKTEQNQRMDHPLLQSTPQTKDIIVRPTYSFKVVGTAFNGIQAKLESLAKEYLEANDPYDGYTNKEIEENGPIYQVSIGGGYEITLEPEPDNPYDKNAIRVIHDELGTIGYVPKGSINKVRKIMNTNDYKVEWDLVGGKIKEYDDDEEKVVMTELNYGMDITLRYAE